MSNKEILTAVLIEWMRPYIPALIGNKLNGIPALNAVENWVKKIGIAPASWSIAQDITPLVQGAAYDIIIPIIMPKLNSIPDEYIPQMAHGIVDSAIQMGEYSILGGTVIFGAEDLKELKNYLIYNLPYVPKEHYKVITKQPQAEGEKENDPQKSNN